MMKKYIIFGQKVWKDFLFKFENEFKNFKIFHNLKIEGFLKKMFRI